ncbi:Protein phosphatase 1D, partial [Stegodyphus mimosarum]
MTLDVKKDICLILASDGLWNIMSPQDAVNLVQDVENENKKLIAKYGVSENLHLTLCNPSKVLVDCALERWNQLRTRADNTSVVTVMLDLNNSAETEVLREQLVLKMNYPHTLQVWDVGKRPKNCCMFSKTTDSEHSKDLQSDTMDDKIVGNKMGYLQLSSKLFDGEGCSSHTESDRHTSSPLQSCSNLLPEYFAPKTSKKTEMEGIENSPCPFPRWSKSASGRTSLSKLATWSKVVSHRRMSDPFPNRNFELGHSSTDDVYSLSDDENNQFSDAENCNSLLFREGKMIDFCEEFNDENTVCTSNDCLKQYDGSKNSTADEKMYKTALDNLCNLKQAIKRKYPGTEISQSYISGGSQSTDKGEGVSSHKRKPSLINIDRLSGSSTLSDVQS